MATTIKDLIAFEPSPDGKPNTFISKHNPLWMGNRGTIAFGGCALAFAISTASATVDTATFHLYSLVGHYLGASSTEVPFTAVVTPIRDTRTFATRTVLISQTTSKDGSPRVVLSAQLDFQRREPATLQVYSPPISPLVSSLAESWDTARAAAELRARPGSTPALLAAHAKTFAAGNTLFERRTVPNSIHSQNMYGILTAAPTTQDNLPITDKTSLDWSRSATHLDNTTESLAAMAFWLDGGIAFMPLTHDHKWLLDVASASSLDFALRVFVNDFDFNDWHLKELKCVTGGEGRTFGHARLWDQGGRLVGEMSQQCILRPHPAKI